MWAKDTKSGFTIVELLIVIVIIAILAAITVVAYNGIQDRAKSSSASSALATAVKKIKYWQAEQDSTSAPTSLTIAGVSETDSVKYQYSQDIGGTYCITATVGNKSYKVTGTNSTPTDTACAGHGSGGVQPITNLSVNPSLETNTVGWSGPNGATIAQSAIRAKDGTRSALVTLPTAGASSVGANTANAYTIPTHFQANTTYMFSTWVYIPAGTVDVRLSAQGNGTSNTNCGSVNTGTTSVKDSWIRLSCQFSTAASGGFALYVLNNAAATAGMTFYVDSVMFTEGTTLHNYADGTSSGWAWGNGNGTPNNSTSTGPSPL